MQESTFYGDLRDASFRIAFPLNKESDESVLFESDVGSDAPAVTLGVPEYVTDTAWIVPVSDDAEKASALDGISGISDLVSAAFLNGLTPKKGEIRVLVSGKKGTVVLCGTGKEGELDQETLAALSSAAGKAVSAAGAVDIVNALPAVPCGELVNDERVRLSTEALIEGSYFSSSWKSAPEKRDFSGTMVYVYPGEESRDLADNCQDGLSGGFHSAMAVMAARDLASVPGNVCHPEYLADMARSLEGDGVTVEILGQKELEEQGMNGYLAATAGSPYPPFMAAVSYRGAGDEKPVVLIGKGLCFDSGGLSLKPAAGMDEMKFDKCGASVVYGVMKSIIDMHLPLNVVGLMCGAENIPGGLCYRPGDIITMKNGLNVEVVNTDAEGRMVLADALSYAEKYSPAVTIDIATLTGGCVIALGHEMSGLMTDDDGLAEALIASGIRTGDLVWRLPLSRAYAKLLKAETGDVLQSAGRDASPVTAAEFLKNFRPKSGTWAHLDIAGTGWNSRGIKGPTGRPASLLLSYLIDLSRGIIRDRRGGTVLAFDAEGPADGFGVEGKGEE